MLSVINLIMDELLAEDRACRAFRAKFPEEVLQESLAGQLWFGAECLAAGSAILNREFESAEMRPLAKAVTKSLENVRNLLRDQCLRHNTPNSTRLELDINDSTTETLYESLKIFDRLFAEFELLYVSAMVTVKTKQEHEVQELICVLFSETLQRALRLGLLEQEQVDSFDPALMFSIPRLAIISGLTVFDNGPLNMEQSSSQLSEMFRPFRKLLIKMRDLLKSLNKNELYQLEKLLCTNEEISLKTQFICDDESNNSPSGSPGGVIPSDLLPKSSLLMQPAKSNNNFYTITETKRQDEWVAESEEQEAADRQLDYENLVRPDCASGYLIPNTNLGNLLQSNEAPLTDSFIASDDELNAAASENKIQDQETEAQSSTTR